MSETTVEELLQKIEQLPEEERALLEERLARRAEVEWKQAAEEARHVARERGLEQATIYQAIQDLRYPR